MRVLCVSDDWVYLGVEEERQEYVMKEQSIIYRGSESYISGLAWDLGQVRTHTHAETHTCTHTHTYTLHSWDYLKYKTNT